MKMGERELIRYEGVAGQVHQWADNFVNMISNLTTRYQHQSTDFCYKDIGSIDGKFSHLHRRKTTWELIRISAVIAGIELSYAVETAFVSPILLQIGIKHRYISMVWAISPIIGFLLCPILGSLSDGCQLALGRRRPFILLLSSGILIGLILVPNGKDLGKYIGDETLLHDNSSLAYNTHNLTIDDGLQFKEAYINCTWGIFFTILGTVLLDSMADSCQSPARSYLVDICHSDDHARGLSTFTVMAGFGGSLGYIIGAIDWGASFSNNSFNEHVQIVFAMITVAFIASVMLTVTSFPEVPLNQLESQSVTANDNSSTTPGGQEAQKIISQRSSTEDHGCCSSVPVVLNMVSLETLNNDTQEDHIRSHADFLPPLQPHDRLTDLRNYLLTLIYMPNSIRMICLTNLCCWMGHVCYSLYFTDFVGEVIFRGIPTAGEGSWKQHTYDEGVRFGCWGMTIYSMTCALYSLTIEQFLKRHGPKRVYVGGILSYSAGMFLMVLLQSKVGVIVLSASAGIMYATVFTMPYILVVHYHVQGKFELEERPFGKVCNSRRGIGTDIAIINSMIFLAQFLVSIILSVASALFESTSVVIVMASFFSLCAAILATNIVYFNL